MQFQTFKNKQLYVSNFINIIRDKGGAECWVLNRKHFEVYHFKAEQITEFDVRIDLRNALTKELVISVNLVLHMKQSMLDLFEEVHQFQKHFMMKKSLMKMKYTKVIC